MKMIGGGGSSWDHLVNGEANYLAEMWVKAVKLLGPRSISLWVDEID